MSNDTLMRQWVTRRAHDECVRLLEMTRSTRVPATHQANMLTEENEPIAKPCEPRIHSVTAGDPN
jgi:hypothetical protein